MGPRFRGPEKSEKAERGGERLINEINGKRKIAERSNMKRGNVEGGTIVSQGVT